MNAGPFATHYPTVRYPLPAKKVRNRIALLLCVVLVAFVAGLAV